MISVVIPLYNKADSILNAINSVLGQSFQDFEIIVVDDGSTDNSAALVQSVNDPRLRLISQKNAGVSAARNKGIEESRAELIAFLDADDVWKPEFLSTVATLARKYPQCTVFATCYEAVDSLCHVTATILNKMPFKGDDGILSNYFEVASCSHPPICSICVMVRKDAFSMIGGFPVGVKSGEDLITWARLWEIGPIAYSTKTLAVYNLGEGYNFSNLPPRRQDSNDYVGEQLRLLLKRHPHEPGLRDYVSLWHKMRASVALRYGETRETLRECAKALRYNPAYFRVLPFVALALMPGPLRRRIIAMKKHI